MANSVDGIKNSTGRATGAWPAFLSMVGAAISKMKALESQANRTAAANARAAASRGGGGGGHFYGGLQYLAQGGIGQDTVLAMLTPGEFVINKENSSKFYSELNAMNNGHNPPTREKGGDITNVGDVNVVVKGGDTSAATIANICQGLRRELRRGTIKL